MRVLLLVVLLLTPAVSAPTAAWLPCPPAGLPQDLPAGAVRVEVARVDFGQAGALLLRFFEVEGEQAISRRVDLLRPSRQGWVRQARLEAHVRPGSALAPHWLRPAAAAGPLVTANDGDQMLVLTFPDGLDGPCVPAVFSDAATAWWATEAYCELGADGQTVVVESTSERDGALSRREYRWTGTGWKEKR